MGKRILRELPVVGGLADCDAEDHWKALQQTVVVLALSAPPIWLGTIIIFAAGRSWSLQALGLAFHRTVFGGELFMFSAALLAPVFWMALVDPPGARSFPSKLSHVVLILIINIVAAVFFGLSTAGEHLNTTIAFKISCVVFWVSLALLYLGTVYQNSRLPEAPAEFKRQEQDFVAEYREHRNEPS